jgi:MraZ protein
LLSGVREVGPVFLGTHAPRLDDKGRLFLPAKYREELSEGLVITKGQERCLYVFPMAEFERITEALRTAPVTAKSVRAYSRVFFASASDETPDKQGRITIPPALRGYAGLDRDCVVIGANTRLEIWDALAWETYLEQEEQQFSDLSEEVLPGVL